jgi:hypothetical protein
MKTIAEVEVTKDDKHFRVIRVRISKVCVEEGQRAMAVARQLMADDEDIYQVCAPCRGCDLSQPFYDFFNGFSLLKSHIWVEHNKKGLTIKQHLRRMLAWKK